MPFLLWGLTLLVYRVAHYGVSSGFFLWFDHLFLIFSGVLFIKKVPRLQVALTYVILIIQSLWALDNLYFLWMGKEGYGTTSFIAQPGLSLFEFFLLQSHFILGPVLLYFLPIEENQKKITPWILLFPAIVFFLSYFTPYPNDLNCIHSSCTPFTVPGPHWFKALLFSSVSCVLLYLLSEGLRRLCLILEKYRRKFAVVLIVLGVCAIAWNLSRHLKAPKFTCEPYENEDAKMECLYTTDSSPTDFKLHYSITLKGKTRKECTPYLILDGVKEPMEKPLLLPPKQIHGFAILVPFPKANQVGKFEIECHDFKF